IQVVALSILTIALDLVTAMAVLLAPATATNIWQAIVGGFARELLTRLWPFLLTVSLAVLIGAIALTRVDLSLLTAFLGVVMIAYASACLLGVQFSVAAGDETWLGPIIGLVNGVITGMTGSSVVPGTMYLQALGLPRDKLVQAMGMLYLVSTLALAVALQANSLLDLELGLYSASAVLPALCGMVLGQKIRRQLAENLFRKVFFIALLVLGAYLLGRPF
ncbi:MAG: sulfite exporter TauE/SafE family protein, partial [Pseudomonadales bacterium]|nr:sulfite exporter TauE/SafE family protein [Pseudomonadales bacterium]